SGDGDSKHVYGVVYAQADGSVYVTESNYELNLLAAKAYGGNVRLTVPDTSLVPTLPRGNPAATTQTGEDLFLLVSGTTLIEQNNEQKVMPSGEVTTGETRSGILAALG